MTEGRSGLKNKKKQLTFSESVKHLKATDHLSCWHQFILYVVYTIHIIDVILGLSFLVIAILILNQGYHHLVGELILFYAIFVLSAAIFGILGFFYDSCDRCGLRVSAYIAPIIGITDAVVGILLLAQTNEVPKGDKEDLYVSILKAIYRKHWAVTIFICSLVFGFAEVLRYYMLEKLSDELRSIDNAVYIDSSSNRKSLSESFLPSRPERNTQQILLDDDLSDGNFDPIENEAGKEWWIESTKNAKNSKSSDRKNHGWV